MTPIPDEIMEQAREAWSNAFHVGPEIETIATALLAAEKRGEEREMERCAKVAAGNSADFDFQKALAECRDSEHGFHSGRLHAAAAIRSGK